MDAARLYERMSTFQGQQMVKTYLYRSPSLHPRRTLNQLHYRGLKTTEARDRDQIMYILTSPRLELMYRFWKVTVDTTKKPKLQTKIGSTTLPARHGQSREDLEGKSAESREAHNEEATFKWQWTNHSDVTDGISCEHCSNAIKKTPKLIIVDQLWMWVLNEQTALTAFPGRYRAGYNKRLDGIHMSIRNRLMDTQIKLVIELALIILDVMFHRILQPHENQRACLINRIDLESTCYPTPQDSQSRLLNIFSEAVGGS